MKIFSVIVSMILSCSICAAQYKYILNDNCISELYEKAERAFGETDIDVIRFSHGIILRFALVNPPEEYYKLNPKTFRNIQSIQYFLAKIENPAIIGVHTENIPDRNPHGIKNWELSTVIANNIENIITQQDGSIDTKKISSVGYGEFLPTKNTPYNGGKYLNRVDIMILCNVSGE